MQKIVGWLKPGLQLKRWLVVLFVGLVITALGAGFLAVELYRTVPLPGAAYWITLQFLDHWQRGVLFLVIGGGLSWYGWHHLSRAVVSTLAPERADEQVGLAELMYERKRAEQGRNVVVIGGGTGLLPVVHALTLLDDPISLRVIPTATDSGYQISLLRDRLGLTGKQVIQPTGPHVQLWAELENGELLQSAGAIEQYENGIPIKQVFFSQNVRRLKVWENIEGQLTPELLQTYQPEVNEKAVDAIREAELIVIAPGRLYSDILPNLTLPEIATAINESEAKKVFVGNIMTDPSKTHGFSIADHLAVIRQVTNIEPDYVLVNDTPISNDVLEKYHLEGALPIELEHEPEDDDVVSKLIFADTGEETTLVEGAIVVSAPLITEEPQQIPYRANGEIRMRELAIARHDPKRLQPVFKKILNDQ